MAVDERVHAIRIGIDGGPGRLREGLEVPLGGLAPAERPDEPILVEGALAEELGQATGRDVAPDLHLPQPLLGMDVALGEEQVMGVLAEDPDDARLIP